MATPNSTQKSFHPLAHVPLTIPTEEYNPAFDDYMFTTEMDRFYVDMLQAIEPSQRKARYQAKLARVIEAVFRVEGVLILIMFSDKSFEVIDEEVVQFLNSNSKEISVSYVIHTLRQQLGNHLSVEFYTKRFPTYQDYLCGDLFNKYDLTAGLKAETVDFDLKMCDWLQEYQHWLQDYLYFNLAQIRHQSNAGSINRLNSLMATDNWLNADYCQQLATIKENFSQARLNDHKTA